ncbi:MAG: hypothetical protein ABEK17_01345 [Candidatus Aenigmatarchaeota archaeon]
MKLNKLKILIFLVSIVIFLPTVKGAVPSIDYVSEYPDPLQLDNTITIEANVSDLDGNIDTVIANFTSPIVENFVMDEVNGTYKYNYTPQLSTIYEYKIEANDTDGNITNSTIREFVVLVKDRSQVRVQIAPSCGVGFSYYYDPKKVIQGQDVLFLQINENIGNVDTNETSEMYVENLTSNIVFGPHDDREVTLMPYETDAFYALWRTSNETPTGKYYWHGITRFISRVKRGDGFTHEWPEFNNTANCYNWTDSDNDGVNETYCLEHINRKCYNTYTDQNLINTTQDIVMDIENKTSGTPVYYSPFNYSNYTWNAYTFNMTDCEGYCYACMSNDTEIDQSNECGYRGETNAIITDLGNFTVSQLDSDGMNVTFSKTFISCTDKYTFSDCLYNQTLDILICSESMQCNGSLEIVEDFEVVTSIGEQNVTIPEPEPEPTPQPQPEPEPEPEPQPQPEPSKGPIRINIRPINKTVEGKQEQMVPIQFLIENLGNSTVENITIEPIPGENWEKELARVDLIEGGETLNRTIFLEPGWNVTPSTYAIPTKALSQEDESLDLAYFWFKVLPGKHLSKIRIVESPNEISLDSESEQKIPILVENIGKKPLSGVSVHLENIDNCLETQSSSEIELDRNEEETLPLTVNTKTGPKTCRATLIVSSDQKAYALARMKINIRPPSALLPAGLPIVPLMTVIFMILVFVLITIRRSGRKINILLYFSVSVLIILVIYIISGYLGYVPLF